MKAHINICLDTELASIARSRGLNMSQLFNNFLKSYLDRRENKQDENIKKRRVEAEHEIALAKIKLAEVEAEEMLAKKREADENAKKLNRIVF